MATSAAKTTSALKSAKTTTDTLETDIQQLRADMAQLVEHMKDLGGHSGSAARNAATESVDQLRAKGEAALESVKGSAGDMEREFVRTVREKPVTSLALAVGAGFLLALVTRR